MILLAGDIRKVFWVALLPALAAVAMLAFGVEEPDRHTEKHAQLTIPQWRDLRRFSTAFWIVVSIGAVVTLARFSEAFLVLRASDAGLSRDWIPLALVVMNLMYVISAYPAGWLSDRTGRIGLLMVGLVTILAADLVLVAGSNLNVILLGIALWGLHMGLTQGLFAALVADTAPADLRGSAFGVFNFVSGVVAVFSSLLAGGLWEWRGPEVTFGAGAAFSVLALAALLWYRFRHANT